MKDVPDATRRSTGAVRTIRMTYGIEKDHFADINYTWHQQTFYGKFKQFDFSVKGLRIQHIHDRCHKDIRDATDMFMDGKYEKSLTISHIW